MTKKISNEKLGYKIREVGLEKVPYMLVLGENEQNSGTAALRKRGEGDLGSLTIQELIERILDEARAKH